MNDNADDDDEDDVEIHLYVARIHVVDCEEEDDDDDWSDVNHFQQVTVPVLVKILLFHVNFLFLVEIMMITVVVVDNPMDLLKRSDHS